MSKYHTTMGTRLGTLLRSQRNPAWRKSPYSTITLSLVAVIIHAIFFCAYFGVRFEPVLQDFWFSLRGHVQPPTEIVVVGQDDETYARLKANITERLSRRYLIKLFERLIEDNARGVALDGILSAPGAEPDVDQLLASTLDRIPTVLGTHYYKGLTKNSTGSASKPLPIFEAAARSLGRTEGRVDFGVQRRFPQISEQAGLTSTPLAEAGAQLLKPLSERPGRRDFINYYGPGGTFVTVPLWQVVEDGYLPKNFFKDKIVFVGSLATAGIGSLGSDEKITPFSRRNHERQFFGVEIHATAAANLLDGSWIRRWNKLPELGLVSALLLIAALAITALRPLAGGILLVLVEISWFGASYYSFKSAYFFLPGVLALLFVLPAVYLVQTLLFYVTTFQAEKTLRRAFSKYVAEDLVDRILAQTQHRGQSVERGAATVMIFDLQGFSALTAREGEEAALKALNHYHSVAAKVVLNYFGTPLSFVADAMVAEWGLVRKVDTPERFAARAALEIIKEVKTLAASGTSAVMQARIGIARGSVVLGNLGSETHLTFSTIGDAPNLANRLEKLNKGCGTEILMSADVANKLSSEEFHLLPVGQGTLRGQDHAEWVYALSPTAVDPELVVMWQQALAAFGQGNVTYLQDLCLRCHTLPLPLQKIVAAYACSFRSLESEWSLSDHENEMMHFLLRGDWFRGSQVR